VYGSLFFHQNSHNALPRPIHCQQNNQQGSAMGGETIKPATEMPTKKKKMVLCAVGVFSHGHNRMEVSGADPLGATMAKLYEI
jgi:hypothetical protein